MAITPELMYEDYPFDWDAIFSVTPTDLAVRAGRIAALKMYADAPRGYEIGIFHSFDQGRLDLRKTTLRHTIGEELFDAVQFTVISYELLEDSPALKPVHTFRFTGNTIRLGNGAPEVVGAIKHTPVSGPALEPDIALAYMSAEMSVMLKALEVKQRAVETNGQA
jgi:hypothetical protein